MKVNLQLGPMPCPACHELVEWEVRVRRAHRKPAHLGFGRSEHSEYSPGSLNLRLDQSHYMVWYKDATSWKALVCVACLALKEVGRCFEMKMKSKIKSKRG
jgi:hypothetical protein